MKKIVFYILLLPVLLYATQTGKTLKIYKPSLVRSGQPFQISSVLEFPPDIDTLFFNINPSGNAKITSVFLRTFEEEKTIPFKKSINSENGNPEFEFFITKEEFPNEDSHKFQIILNVSGIRKETTFEIVSYTREKTQSPDLLSQKIVKYENTVEVKTYQTQKPAGKLIRFDANSNFLITLTGIENTNRLLTEFWAKFDSPVNEFFKVIIPESEEMIFGLSVNKFQSLEISGNPDAVFFNNCFISKKAWYHFTVLTDKESEKTSVFVNDVKYCEFENEFSQTPKTLAVEFLNSNPEGRFFIDLLKIWDFGNRLENSFLGKHFLHYAADSSEVLLDLNFDRDFNELSLSRENAKISFGGIQQRRSDAPIFSTVPDLNVSISESYNTIEWKETEYSFANTFILEKSPDGREFTKIYEVDAENEPGKSYYYSDYKEDNSKIVFYRIKQINVDQTVSFSPTVKVGQAEHKDFLVEQNYPNPFNPLTTIKVNVLIPGEYKIVVYDLVGNTVALLHEGYLNEGLHSFEFNGADLPSGIYFYEVAGKKSSNVYKMILAK